jgi:endonuclease-3
MSRSSVRLAAKRSLKNVIEDLKANTVVKQEVSETLVAPSSMKPPQVMKDDVAPTTPPQAKMIKSEPQTPEKQMQESSKTPISSGSKRVKKERTPRKAPKYDWHSAYVGIREWRSKNQAPVDTMGCDVLAESHVSPALFRYQTLVALQLSSQTKDPVVAEAMTQLKSHPSGGLSIDSVLEMSDQQLNSYICKVGFHNRKTEYLKKTAKILKDEYGSDIPKTVDEIMKLPGVGPKMAYLLLQSAWKE